MDKVQKSNSFECYTASSEPFRFYQEIACLKSEYPFYWFKINFVMEITVKEIVKYFGTNSMELNPSW
jgi:hypothetical protein